MSLPTTCLPTLEQATKLKRLSVIVYILAKYEYLPTSILSDKGSEYVSERIKEAAYVLEITAEYATTSNARMVGMPE